MSISTQLGFCVPIEGDDHLEEVAHRSPDYNKWDGGQVGGKPVWLNPEHLPSKVVCKDCVGNRTAEDVMNKKKDDVPPMRFICQIYAPVDYPDSDRAFHRSLYVFACSTCCSSSSTKPSKGVRVLRAQLPAQNPYYPNQEGEMEVQEEVNWRQHLPSEWNQNLCAVCGVSGKGKCPLQQLYFCGPLHQREYKTRVFDKKNKPLESSETSDSLPSVYPMTQLVVEDEPDLPSEKQNGKVKQMFGNDSTKRTTKIRDYESDDDDDDDDDDGGDDGDKKNDQSDDDDDADLEQDDLNKMTGAKNNSISQDPITMQFYERIQQRPNVREQCLRYCRWPTDDESADAPLWIRQECRAQEQDVPPCPYCGGKRRFEFQLMPQMLHYLLDPKKRAQSTKTKQALGNNRFADPEKYAEFKEAIAQTDSLLQQTPPELIPPALVDARDAAIKQIHKDLDAMSQSVNEVDWGIVAVYTCIQSCDASMATQNNVLSSQEDGLDPELGAYREEFAWIQPSLDT